MPIIRVEKHRHNYVIIDKSGLEDERLSIRARGLLAILLTKPDDWEINLRYLAAHNPKEGREALSTAMRELEQYGYARRVLQRAPDGTLQGYETVIYETPDLSTAEVGLTDFGKSATEVGSSEVASTEVGKTDLGGKECIYLSTKDPKNQELKETNTPPSPSSRGAVAGSSFSAASEKPGNYSAAFESWWITYPAHRRIDKKACYKTWVSKHLDARSEAIEANTAAMKRTKQWQADKIPNSTTYLSQERYDTQPMDGASSQGLSETFFKMLDEQGIPYERGGI